MHLIQISRNEKSDRLVVHSQTVVLLSASLSYLILTLPYISYILLMPIIRYGKYSFEWEHTYHNITSSDNDLVRHSPNNIEIGIKYTDYKIVDDTGEDLGKYSAAMYLWYIVSICFMYINNSINFYLYCLAGKTFRDQFMNMMRCNNLDKTNAIEIPMKIIPQHVGHDQGYQVNTPNHNDNKQGGL